MVSKRWEEKHDTLFQILARRMPLIKMEYNLVLPFYTLTYNEK